MKFDDLSMVDKRRSIKYFMNKLINRLVGREITFDDKANKDDFQARVDAAIEKAEDNRTPWFAGEYMLEDSYLEEMIYAMARSDAKSAIYLHDDDEDINVVRLGSLKDL